MKKKDKKGFTMAEMYIVFIVLGVLILVVAGFALKNRNNQAQFNAKLNKIENMITNNIQMDINTNTGRRFASYENNNELFVSAILDNVNCERSNTADKFWGNNRNFEEGNPIQNDWTFAKLSDGGVIAIDNDSTTVYIDANGKSAPNELNKDIKKYSSPIANQQGIVAQDTTVNEEFFVCPDKGPAPADKTYTYTWHDADGNPPCKWVKSGCVNAAKTFINNNECTCTVEEPNDEIYTYAQNEITCAWYKTGCKENKHFINGECSVCPNLCADETQYQTADCTCHDGLQITKTKTSGSFYANTVAFTNGRWGSLSYSGNIDRYTSANGTQMDIYTDYLTNDLVDLRVVIHNGYFCAPVNGGTHFECHINGGQVPDIQYDKNGNVTAVVCNKYWDQLGDCSTAIAGCTTALCDWDDVNKIWFTGNNEEAKDFYNAARCYWVELNGNTLDGCEKYLHFLK